MKKLIYLFLFVSFVSFSQDIQLGNQAWTAVNLDVTQYQNGDPIPEVENLSEWRRLKEGAYCIYEGEKLYNWYAVNDSRGLAPNGYHIPSYSEWMELLFYLKVPITKNTTSAVLKSSGFYSYNTGIRDMLIGNSGYKGGYSNWWCIDDYDNFKAYHCVVYDARSAEVTTVGGYKGHGLSVRCIKDR
tara:strand:+ start:167 stop:724 length:558 start_codon:yes stop_codon:yes gene_type:complete